jgi:hypothetical protein
MDVIGFLFFIGGLWVLTGVFFDVLIVEGYNREVYARSILIREVFSALVDKDLDKLKALNDRSIEELEVIIKAIDRGNFIKSFRGLFGPFVILWAYKNGYPMGGSKRFK